MISEVTDSVVGDSVVVVVDSSVVVVSEVVVVVVVVDSDDSEEDIVVVSEVWVEETCDELIDEYVQLDGKSGV